MHERMKKEKENAFSRNRKLNFFILSATLMLKVWENFGTLALARYRID